MRRIAILTYLLTIVVLQSTNAQGIKNVTFDLGPEFVPMQIAQYEGTPVMGGFVRQVTTDLTGLIMLKRDFKTGYLNTDSLLTSREIASYPEWDNQWRADGQPVNEETRRYVQGYKMDERIRMFLKRHLTPEAKARYFERNAESKPEPEGRTYRIHTRNQWGGSQNPFNVKNAYEYFLSVNPLKQLEEQLESVPMEANHIFRSTISAYDFLSGSFKVTVYTSGILDENGNRLDNFVYAYKVDEEKAAEMTFPGNLIAVLKVRLDPNNDLFLERLANSRKKPEVFPATILAGEEVQIFGLESSMSEITLDGDPLLAFKLLEAKQE